MIRLEKLAVPEKIAKSLSDYVAKLYAAIAQVEKAKQDSAVGVVVDEKTTRIPKSLLDGYNTSDVKDLLKQEAHEKCAYCESQFSHVYFGDIEHIIPKFIGPEQRYDWNNLTLACALCNNKKRDYNDPHKPLINPYTDEPEEHIFWSNSCIVEKRCSTAGWRTVQKLDIRRPELNPHRWGLLDRLESQVADFVAETNFERAELILEQLWEEAQADRPYAGMVRAWLMTHPDLNAAAVPAKFKQIADNTRNCRSKLYPPPGHTASSTELRSAADESILMLRAVQLPGWGDKWLVQVGEKTSGGKARVYRVNGEAQVFDSKEEAEAKIVVLIQGGVGSFQYN